MMKKKFAVLMLVAIMAGSAIALGPELVANGDFESGTFQAGTVPDGWSGETGDFWITSVSAYYNYDDVVQWTKASGSTGNQWVEVMGRSSGFKTAVSQTIAIEGGHLYDWSFRTMAVVGESGLTGSDAVYNGYGYYEFVIDFDAGDDVVREGYQPVVDGWMTISGTAWVSSDATTANLRMWGTRGSKADEYGYFVPMVQAYDDVSIWIPEPLTMSLLGLGGLMLRRRKA
jgi:hypothetical protein